MPPPTNIPSRSQKRPLPQQSSNLSENPPKRERSDTPKDTKAKRNPCVIPAAAQSIREPCVTPAATVTKPEPCVTPAATVTTREPCVTPTATVTKPEPCVIPTATTPKHKPCNTPAATKPKRQRSKTPTASKPNRERCDTSTATKSSERTTQENSLSDGSFSVPQCGLNAWNALKEKAEDRMDFRKKEIVQCAVAELEEKGVSALVVSKLEKEMACLFRKGAMFKKSTRPDAPLDAFQMHNPKFVVKVAKGKEPRKKGAAKKGGVASGAGGDSDVILVSADINKANVPDEWSTEAYKPVRLSQIDKAWGIEFVGDEKDNVVKGCKGYRSIRATSGVSEGDWYFECELMPFKVGNVRVGWSMRRTRIDTPVGYDAYGFSYRDLTGDFVHDARPKKYGDAFGVGDVIGCRIVMPELSPAQKVEIAKAESRWLFFQFLSKPTGPRPKDSGIDLFPHGRVEFFKNGRAMGVPKFFSEQQMSAESIEQQDSIEVTEGKEGSNGKPAGKKVEPPKNMIGGVYYPTVALYRDAVVKMNFGPHFKYHMPQGSRPMCDAARDAPPPLPVEKVDTANIPKEHPNLKDDKGSDVNNNGALRAPVDGHANTQDHILSDPANVQGNPKVELGSAPRSV